MSSDGIQRESVEQVVRESIGAPPGKQKALSESVEHLRLITDSLPVLVSYIDTEQRYRFVSAAYQRWFGAVDLVGKHLSEVLGNDGYASLKPRIDRALSGETVRYEGEVQYRHGGTRFVDATYIPHVAPDGSVAGFVALVADISDKKRLERLNASAATRADRLLKVTAAIADAVTTDEVFQAVVDRAAEAVGASSAALWLVEGDKASARLVHALGYPSEVRKALQILRLDTDPPSPASDSIRRAEPIWIPSKAALLEAYPHLVSLASHVSYRIACLPLVTRGRVLGTLGITIEGEHEIAGDEQGFLLLLARYAGQAIERLRLLEQERASRAAASAAARRMGVLSHASQVFMAPTLNLETRVRAIVAEIGHVLSSTVGVALVQADGLLHSAVVYHPDPTAQQWLTEVGQASPLRPGSDSVTGHVFATGKSAWIEAVDPEALRARAAPAYRAFLDRFPTYGAICVPLRASGHTLGTVMASRLTQEAYSSDDLRLLEELAERAAAAIENSRLFTESRTAQRRAEQLYKFAQAVASADKIELVYDAAISAIEAALQTTRSAILILDNGVMQFRAWRNLSDAYRAAVDGHSPWSPDERAAEPVLVPNAAVDPTMSPFLGLFEREGIAALAFIPMILEGRLLGKFMVYYPSPRAFDLEEIESARAIASHLASVIARFDVIGELKETIRSNELFAGVLAHDLRNPLGAMMNAAQVVLIQREGEAVPGRESKPLGRILSSGRRMTAMIDQLLDFTRARSGGGISIEPQLVTLDELCVQVTQELELVHPHWVVRTEVSGSLLGCWDPDRLLQVVSNLVANAGDHGTPGAGVTLTLNGVEQDTVWLSVHNLGAIPSGLLPHLFDPFRTARNPSNPTRGVGLGLYIVREIVRAHSGTVEVVSDEVSGTTFTIRLPRYCIPAASGSKQERAH